MRFQRLVAETVAVFTCLAFVAGCTSSPSEPEPLPEPTRSSAASPSPSPSPTATPPTLPAEADGTSPAAAKAFVRFYVATLNYATITGKTETLDELAAAGCQSCSTVSERISAVYSSGGHIKSAGWEVKSMSLLPGQPRQRPILDVGVEMAPQSVVEREGAAPQSFEGGRLPTTFHLERDGSEWLVIRLERSA